MRYAGNFHQEWGYLAPAPNFIRTARVVLVATAIGATAGAGVVFSLVGRADTETSVAARTLARPVEAASARLNAPPAASARPASGVTDRAPPAIAADAPRAGTADSESKPSSTTLAPAGIAALAEVPAVADDGQAHLATVSLAAAPSPATVEATFPAPSPAAPAPAKAAAGPPAVAPAAADPAPGERKIAVAKKRVVPHFASRGSLPRPGEYYMSADNYSGNGMRGTYYRESGWGRGYQSGGRFQDW